jgi:hypothetical protein
MPAYPNNRHGYPFGGPFRYDPRGLGIVFREPEPIYEGEPPEDPEERERAAAFVEMERQARRTMSRRRRESRLHQQAREWQNAASHQLGKGVNKRT